MVHHPTFLKLLAFFMVSILLAVVLAQAPLTAAEGPGSNLNQQETCRRPVKFRFPSVTLNADNGPKYVRIEAKVDKDCHVSASTPIFSMQVPAQDPGSLQGRYVESTQKELDVHSTPDAPNATRTAVVNQWEEDCCGIRTIGLETSQPWTYTGSIVTLASDNSVTDWCCYWWHKYAGPSYSKGYTSSS